MRVRLMALSLLCLPGCVAVSLDARTPPAHLDPARVVDLTYDLGEDTVYWPTARSFTMERVSYGHTEAGFFYAANNVCMAEHGGTHMDAPIHFAEGRLTADQVPLDACIGPAVIVDVRDRASADRDYRLTADDLREWEESHGRIPDKAIVVMWSGWGERWPNKERYLGTAKPGDTANLHFPGFSREAATFLIQRRNIAAIAVDTPSIDYGQSKDFIVHQIINGANKPGFENIANLHRLPLSGATILALPLKIKGGSGAPARVVAILP